MTSKRTKLIALLYERSQRDDVKLKRKRLMYITLNKSVYAIYPVI